MDKSSETDTKYYRKLFLILGLAGFVSAADNWFVAPSLSAISDNFGTSVAATGGILIRYISWRGAFLFFAGIAIAAAILLRALPCSRVKINRQNHNFFKQCKLAVSSPKGKVIFPLAFVIGLLLLGTYGYLGSFLNEHINLNYMQSGSIVMFYGFSCLIGGSQIGKLANRFGRKKVSIAGEGFALISTVLLICSFQIKSWPIALAATICLGFGYIAIQSTLATLALSVTGECRGLPSGLIGFGLFRGGGVGSMIGGRLLLILITKNLSFDKYDLLVSYLE